MFNKDMFLKSIVKEKFSFGRIDIQKEILNLLDGYCLEMEDKKDYNSLLEMFHNDRFVLRKTNDIESINYYGSINTINNNTGVSINLSNDYYTFADYEEKKSKKSNKYIGVVHISGDNTIIHNIVSDSQGTTDTIKYYNKETSELFINVINSNSVYNVLRDLNKLGIEPDYQEEQNLPKLGYGLLTTVQNYNNRIDNSNKCILKNL